MLIDWFTVIAQVVNFLILVWLMKRFLYTPILNAIDAREKRIATEIADADAKKSEAQKERDEFKRKNEELDQQRESLLNEAMLEIKTERQQLLEGARKEAEDFRARQQDSLINDCNNLKEDIVRRTREEVFAIARKTLGDLATESLEERMVDAFIRRCRALSDGEKDELQSAFKAATGPVIVRSAFPLPVEQRNAIERATSELFSCKCLFHYEVLPDLVSGIELSVDGHEVAWNISEYFHALEKNVCELLIVPSQPEVRTELNPAESKPESQVEPKPEYGAGGHGR
jgi:F-type H+-transporting ATPase subunit b